MCEFCTQHGEGEKWYLQAKNYSDDLLADVRRRGFIEKFFSDPEAIARDFENLQRLEKAPKFIKNIYSRIITRKMKKIHFGQVVPLEEVEKIFGFVNTITRVACICRHTLLGQEKRSLLLWDQPGAQRRPVCRDSSGPGPEFPQRPQ